MHKLIVMYKRPENIEEFERAYQETHLPIVAQMPNLRGFEINRIVGAPGTEPEYYLVAEFLFDTREALMEAMASDAGAEAARNLNSFARGLFTMMFAETDDATGGRA